jgi:4-amino-4-deoxy-L-arabinose transferase-like glycosyltransferase
MSFMRLGIPLQEPQEARYAEIPRQMLVAGNWLVPTLHREPYLDKPPLLYWLVMTSYSLFGVHDWAARLVPCTATFLTLLVTFLWGRRVLGERGGFLAGMILCLSPRYVQLGRMLTMDSLLCLFVVSALAGAHLALRGPGFGWRLWLASALACGLGLLTKGPIALVLVAAPALLRLLQREAPRPSLTAWLAYGMVSLGIAAPWFIVVLANEPAFADYFFWKHHVERFVSPFDHQEPFWFYAPELVLGMLPWTLLLPGMGRWVWRQKSGPLGYLLTAFGWCVLFLSLAGCKRPAYILPAMPLLALAVAGYLDATLPHEGGFLSLARCASPLAFAATMLALTAGIAATVIGMHLRLVKPTLGTSVALLSLFALAWLLRRGPRSSWLICGAVTLALLVGAIHQGLPGYARRFSMRGQVRPLADLCSDASIPVACYPRRWDSVSFYLQREDVRSYSTEERPQLITDLAAAPRTLVFVKSSRALKELRQDLPASCEFVAHGRQGTVLVGMVRRMDRYPASANAAR